MYIFKHINIYMCMYMYNKQSLCVIIFIEFTSNLRGIKIYIFNNFLTNILLKLTRIIKITIIMNLYKYTENNLISFLPMQ